jgi:acetyltransferase-like isoleucine patch superfamily enzyme
MARSLKKHLFAKIAFFAPGGFTLRPWLHRARGVRIGNNVWIGLYVAIDADHPQNIIIKDNVTIGLRTTIFSHLYWGNYAPGKKIGNVIIEKNVYIGPHCVILQDVTIGEGSVIAAGSVVTKNVPPGVLYGPPPAAPLARVTHPLVRDNDYKKFLLGLRKL